MTEFKVGDRVQVKDDAKPFALRGLEGVVRSSSGGPLFQLSFENEVGWRHLYAEELELIEPAENEWKTDPHQDLVNHMRDLLQDWKDTFDKKQRAYGSHAIAGSPFGAEQGLVTRMHDKMSRLVQLINNPDVDDIGEAVRDTVQDMGIYCAMLVLVKDGKWPGV